MSNKLYEENDIQAIATAIREKNGSTDTYKVSEMAEAISEISGGKTKELSGTELEIFDAEQGNVVSLKLKGNSYQKTLSGKNLIKFYTGTVSYNGRTYKFSDNGFSITGSTSGNNTINLINGERTGDWAESLKITNTNSIYLEAGTYYLNCAKSQVSIYVALGNIGSNYTSSTGKIMYSGGYASFTISTSCYATFGFYDTGSGTKENLKCQLEKDRKTDYEEYCGGIPSPSINYPQQINSISSIYEIVTDGETKEQIIEIPCQQNFKSVGNIRDEFVKVNGIWKEKHNIQRIENYNGETITTDYISTTGGLNTGATIDYVLENPYYIECNISQKNMLNNLKNIQMYSNYTHIYSTDNIKPYIELKYKNIEKNDFDTNYQEVEYIATTGTQYIDTGYKPNNNTEIYCTVMTGTGAGFPFGAYTSNDENSRYMMWQGAHDANYVRNLFREGNMSLSAEITYSYINQLINVSAKNKKFILNNTTTDINHTNTFQSSLNLYILARNNNGTAEIKTESATYMFRFKIYESGNLKRNFVPCYRKTDNVIGMYDRVEHKFYTNAGTGTFLKGADI